MTRIKLMKFFSIIIFLLLSFNLLSKESLNFKYPLINKQIAGVPIWSFAEDSLGTLWVGTHSGVYKYNGTSYKNIPIQVNSKTRFDIRVNVVFYDNNHTLWLGTNKFGLFYLKNDIFIKFILTPNMLKIKSIIGDNNTLWVGGKNGIFRIDSRKEKNTYLKFISLEGKLINALSISDSKRLIIGTNEGLLGYDFLSDELVEEKKRPSLTLAIRSLYKYKNIIYVGTNSGLYFFHENSTTIQVVLKNKFINSIQGEGGNIWIGTVYNGLYKFDTSTKILNNYKNNELDKHSIADNAVNAIFISSFNHMWIGTFNNGLNYYNFRTQLFKIYNTTKESISCSKSRIFSSFFTNNKNWWIGTEHGLIRYNSKNMECEILQERGTNKFSSNMIVSIDYENDILWVSTGSGLNKLNTRTLEVDTLTNFIQKEFTYFSMKYKLKYRIVGALSGLYLYDMEENRIEKYLYDNSKEKQIEFFTGKKNKLGLYFFATSDGLKFLNAKGKISKFATKIILPNKSIYTLYLDEDDSIWAGVEKLGLYHLSAKGQLLAIVNKELNFSKPSFISTIEKDNDGYFWLGTDDGLIRYDAQNNNSMKFNKTDGLQNDSFLIYSSFKDQDGNLFFGGRHGFNKFNPHEIRDKRPVLDPVLTKLSLLNQEVQVQKTSETGFKLPKPINDMDKIELGYQDYILGFEFAALDYDDPMRNKYAYRLLGFNVNWVPTDAKNRQVTYTNLAPGEYTFQVKVANKDGIWSEKPKELKIIVHPAWWFSPFAYVSYLLLAMFTIWTFIRYQTIASRKRAIALEKTVALRTQEVQMQKKMVESLLEHKNEVFANVTHEFKTPLALILGPTEQLAKRAELIKHADEFNMIQRNAKRLMLMVGQILKLSQAENDKEVLREVQNVKSCLLMLYESFGPLAMNKMIHVALDNQHDVNVYATSECLEIVIGNLLSNAIKFTNEGGCIHITSTIKNKQINISVQDTGSGIQEHDQEKIFTRFTRLESHKNIAGTGIGLSVVKEITIANGGQVKIDSTWGKGTTFTVSFPITDMQADEEMSQIMVDQMVANTHNELNQETSQEAILQKKNKVTVLIVEDNIDMQKHIGSVLSSRFNCLFADRGKNGIAIALKEMPDIVICDVMMPEMDGYQVTRILRHDNRTSHIPIVLLTALNTTQSRIKGWRENIDTYMTKPFNAQELIVQLDNILILRSLLQKKTSKAFKSNQTMESLELSKQDAKFIEKLRDVIGKLYANEYIQKADIANKMAISERHLDRKVKALIGETAMNMLRAYRLEKACMKLKDGYQVAIVSDECGFSSVAYFCRRFKQKYGLTAKQYQTLHMRTKNK